MDERRYQSMRRLVAVAVLVLIAGGVALLLRGSGEPPTGPVAIAWDDEVCAECHMHVGDPRYAAQLQTRDGQVLNFDDAGCLFRYVARMRPAVHATYFRDSRSDAFLDAREARFVPATDTPMGYGFGAVRGDAPGAIGLEEARRRVLESPEGGGR